MKLTREQRALLTRVWDTFGEYRARTLVELTQLGSLKRGGYVAPVRGRGRWFTITERGEKAVLGAAA